MSLPETVAYEAGVLRILDQRLLPGRVAYLEPTSIEDVWHAIQTLAVRGAPAIGIAAGYGLAMAMGPWRSTGSAANFAEELTRLSSYLQTARPTAVNLAWACERLGHRAQLSPGDAAALLAEAQAIHTEDRQICRAIGNHGEALIETDAGILTHCNAGALAVSELGTATAPMYTAHALGRRFKVFADETRPLYQGARLTAWELNQVGIDVELICDNSAATLMARGEIQLAIVGTDRVTANGDVVNKIGTLGVAIACAHFGIPFYVACPSSTFDPSTPRGRDVPIEVRDSAEVLGDHAAAVPARNLAFDVTPAALVTGIITEHGIVQAPYEPGLQDLLGPPER
ncbi:MAG: S-methyl-5-thioribose-1-phosphate isomerase [Pseudomonadales bacterium]